MDHSTNLAWVLAERASKSGWYDKPAYYAPHAVTHGEIHSGAAHLGQALRLGGLSSGDRVLVCLSDSPELVQILLACLARGILVFLSNPELHPNDHLFQQHDIEPALVIASNALRDRFDGSDVLDVQELMSHFTGTEPATYEPVTTDTPAYATYTSGTTGLPKAAMHRHGDPLTFVEAMCRHALRLSSQDIGLSSARMYFAYGLGNSVWFPLATGGSSVISKSPMTAEAAADRCSQFETSILYAVPTVFSQILDRCTPEAFRSLRCVVSAGEVLTPGLAERMAEFFGGIPILDGIGSTEVGQTFISNRIDRWRNGTLGKVLPPYVIRVVNESGATVGPGEEGDLLVRGPSIALGYWNQSPTESTITENGWLRTGDRVSLDTDGWVFYRCRADDIEVVGGLNVNPQEPEAQIIRNEDVADAAVIGVREPAGASALQAFLVPKVGAVIDDSTIRDIHSQLLKNLAPYKVPHRFVTVDRLPRTPNGKLMRSVLRGEKPTIPIWEKPFVVRQSHIEVARDGKSNSDTEARLENPFDSRLNGRLSALQQERYRLVLEAVCTEAARMLGETSPQYVNPDLSLSEQGFDSQMSVELRNRLALTTGLRLADTVVFDYGSASRLAQFLESQLSGRDTRAV
ncbi:AMP-binding protein, partial [Mycobacterium paragordonae]|uniref:AMP-binding protein n=1 Tax=Mycobacterium paragordonae TaxID=1389713 RepID=UPI0039882B60